MPAEYFFGRWVQGHEIEWYRWASSEDDSCNGTLHYSYTHDTYQLGLSYIQPLIFYRSTDTLKATAALHGHFRPVDNWQFGLDQLDYRVERDDKELTAEDPREWLDVTKSFFAHLSSRWQNGDTVRVPREMCPYVYLVGKFFGRKTLQFDSDLWIELDSETRESHTPVSTYRGGERHPVFTLVNEVSYGITDRLNAALRFGLVHDYRTLDSRRTSLSSGTSYHDEIQAKSVQLFYKVAFANKLPVPIFLSGSFEQWFKHRTRDLFATRLNVGGDLSTRSLNEEEKLQEITKRVRFGAHFITSGRFDPGIILDDYNNYYRGMLFHKQIRISTDFWYREYGRPGTTPRTYADLSAVAAFGLYDRCEVSASALYQYYDRETCYNCGRYYSESLVYSFQLKYRTFSYDPTSGPGWDRDGRYDIAFRPVLLPKLGVMELIITPPALSHGSEDEVGILSLDRLTRSDRFSFSTSGAVGIGVNAELTAATDWQYIDASLLSSDLKLSGRLRTAEKYDISLSIAQIWHKYMKKQQILELAFRALL